MNFDGYSPQTVPRFGSLVQSDDPTELPFGVASGVQNCHYRNQSVGPRDGVAVKLKFGAQGNSVSGFGVLRYLAADTSAAENIQIIAATKTDGNLWAANPFTQASVQQLTTEEMLANAGLSAGSYQRLYAQCAQAYNKMIVCFSDLTKGVARPLIVDGETLNTDPLSDKPIGDTWQPNTLYRVGHIVSPSVNNGSTQAILFRCTQTGLSGATEPVWPSVDGATINDPAGSGAGFCIWEKFTLSCSSGLESPAAPVFISSEAGAAVPAGATLFLTCTFLNQYGESIANVVNADGSIGNVLQWKNTTGADANIEFLLPVVPTDILALAAQYAVTSVNIYGYLAAGVPDPTYYLDPTSYALVGAGAPGTAYSISAAPAGQQIPQVNTAYSTPAGNVSSGVRYMIVLYMTRSGYICGWSGPVPVACNITVDGRKMLVQNLPIGPYNCAARICAFTVAGQSSAGPYYYINSDDYVNPGQGEAQILQTATKIPDNLTTTAYFDFLDTFLPGASNATSYFNRIEIPPCVDAYFSKPLNRVIYSGCLGYPSSLLISDLEDAEGVEDPGSVVNVSLTDGDRVVCARNHGNTLIAYKENSAARIVPNDGDPSDWSAETIWEGSGPCGPKALDSATNEQTQQKIHAYAHRTGGYTYLGGPAPTLVTRELMGTPENPGVWDQINWAYSYLIRTAVNLTTREVYFHVPLNGATRNNTRITVNFMNGWDDPIVFVQRSGREVPNLNGRRWSVDNVAANDCQYVPQRTSVEA